VAENPQVRRAVPYAVGDNYEGFRIVGTTRDLFETDGGSPSSLRVTAGGQLFDVTRKEAVLGSTAARESGLAVGDTFHPYHGLVFEESMRHDEEYHVIGILEPSNTPADRVIWIPIDGIYRMSGHVLRGSGEAYEVEDGAPIPNAHKEVSAVMLELRSPQAGFFLDQMVNKQGKVATLAWPIGRVMAELFQKLGWATQVLTLVAYLVVLVAAGSIVASITNTMNERRREFAILRALGARRRTVSAAIVLEAGAIGALGAGLGFPVYALIFALARAVVKARTGVVLDPWSGHVVFVLAPIAVVLLAAAAGTLPARQAYATDVATHLNPTQ
jgi:putative ABC transport system permease protein